MIQNDLNDGQAQINHGRIKNQLIQPFIYPQFLMNVDQQIIDQNYKGIKLNLQDFLQYMLHSQHLIWPQIMVDPILPTAQYKYKYLQLWLIILSFMIYFIRHAESLWNIIQDQLQQQLGQHCYDQEAYRQEKFNIKYLDTDITQRGISQSIKTKESFKSQHVDLVLVSPLRRALHTCSIIFEGHPSNPTIIVEPAFRQIMESSCDIGSIKQSMQKYPFDFDQIKDPDAWFVSTLHQEDRDRINGLLQDLQGENRKEKAIEECLKIEKENWIARRSHLENQEKIKQRVLPNIQKQKQIIQFYLKQFKSIAIVGHSICIKKIIGFKIDNCQIAAFNACKLSQIP